MRAGLRSILRHDPDVILIGEIRDQETAQIAVQASLTGHLVFSTLHTNDAPGALTRLVDMGVEPYLVASSLEAVLAQRLVRVLCKHCKQPDDSPAARAFKAQVGIPANAIIYKSVGCRECRNTGFYGRHAIFEWMDSDNEIRQLILKNGSNDLIRDAARRAGMRTLAEDGWRLVRMGITTVEEVLSVTTAKEVARTTKNDTMDGLRKPRARSRSTVLDRPCLSSSTKRCKPTARWPRARSRPRAAPRPSARWKASSCAPSISPRRPRTRPRVADLSALTSKLPFQFKSEKVGARELENFTRLLSSLLSAGVPLSRALVILHKESSSPAAAAKWKQIYDYVVDGMSLADAMAKLPETFPRVYVAMVEAGETGGFLDVVLAQIADFQTRERDLRAR